MEWVRVVAGRVAAVVAMAVAGVMAWGQTGTLPVMYIETEGHRAITSKTVYLPANYFIVDTHNAANNVGSQAGPLPLEIRGRGHSSWRGTKKPYKIKLAEKTPLLGMNKHKHWALLKFYEPTVAGLELGKMMGMEWTASTRPVEVVLNGANLGLYLLTETNRISKNRLDIYEQPNWNEDAESIPYGWLVEVDNYPEPNQITVRENNEWLLRLTYHSPDSLSDAQHDWLMREFREINEAVYDADKTSGRWERLIDVEAMARYFIIQELLDNSDGFHGSFYLHKDWSDDARWVAGPLWDLSCNQRVKTDYTFRMKTSYGFTPHWIGELIKDEDFCREVRHAWREFYPAQMQQWLERAALQLLPCAAAYEREKEMWNYTNRDPLETKITKLKSALLANAEWFNNHLPHGVQGSVDDGLPVTRTAVRVDYVNLSGQRSTHPWSGVNIRVTTYDDGSTSTDKLLLP